MFWIISYTDICMVAIFFSSENILPFIQCLKIYTYMVNALISYNDHLFNQIQHSHVDKPCKDAH